MTNTSRLRYERPIIKKLNTGLMNKFGVKTEYAPVTHIDGKSVKELIHEYGSPLFVLSESQIRNKYTEAVHAFQSRYPKVQFAWSYKTNYINGVCKLFHQLGSWAEVVSRFEYDKAVNNGVPPEKIIFNGPDKSAEDLEVAIRNNSLIHIDHFDELYLLTDIVDRIKLRPRVAIRVNMDTGVYPIWDRFGFNYENGQAWNAIAKILALDKMDLVGLHCHIGTFMLTASAYAVAASKLSDLALGIQLKYDKSIEYLDLGGGFASTNTLKGSFMQGSDYVPSINDYAEAITTTLLNAGFKRDRLPLLILESGRYLIDEAGYLLGTVIANKRLSDGRRATIMDFGVNILFTSFWYDHKISPAQEFSTYSEDMVLYGPLCMNIDVIRDSINLPLLNVGDNVVVHKVGAYNMTQWMQFISMRPNVTIVDLEDNAHLLRAKEDLAYLEKLEVIPDYLKSFKL